MAGFLALDELFGKGVFSNGERQPPCGVMMGALPWCLAHYGGWLAG